MFHRAFFMHFFTGQIQDMKNDNGKGPNTLYTLYKQQNQNYAWNNSKNYWRAYQYSSGLSHFNRNH